MGCSKPAWMAAVVLYMVGCDHVLVEHAGAPPSLADAGEDAASLAATEACMGAQDGERCDDFDICTPSSTCLAGECVGGTSFDGCVVADSLAEFGEEQGEDGWHYGYWNASRDADGSYQHDTDFEPLEFCGDNKWEPPGRCGVPTDAPEHTWTMVLNWSLMHPETDPDRELPIRRWVSDVSGPAQVTLQHWLSGSTGDGTRALLVVDGVERWRHDSPGGDREGVTEVIPLELRVGTVVDQILHPIGTSGDDMTHFSIVIEGA